MKNFFTTYNGMLHPDALIGGWQRYQQKEINNDILVSYGYGDGGGGPTRAMLENSDRMEKGVTGLPRVRQAFARTYFDELNARVQGSNRLPVWEGELYFEYHRGTYTSMARNKRSNRKAELHMMDLELLSVLAQDRLPYPAQEMDGMWKTILLNQFHDILPGSLDSRGVRGDQARIRSAGAADFRPARQAPGRPGRPLGRCDRVQHQGLCF